MRTKFSFFSLIYLCIIILGGSEARGQSAGKIAAWGSNEQGQCDVPWPNFGFTEVAGGFSHSLGLKSDGSIVAWGRNVSGSCDVPNPNTDFVAVAGGYSYSMGLRSNGSIVAWGSNSQGQRDIPEPNADFVAIAGGFNHSLGLKSNGSIVAWGRNVEGQCDVPEPNTDFVAIAEGDGHSLGLKSDGTIVTWGSNMEGVLDIPLPNEDFVAISGGYYHSLGLKSDGSIVVWGSNSQGIHEVPEPNTDFIAIAGGFSLCLGLKSDGEIVAWGRNYEGQSDVPEPNDDFLVFAAGYFQCLGILNSFQPQITFEGELGDPISCEGTQVFSLNYTPGSESFPLRGYSVRIFAENSVTFSASDFVVNTLPSGDQIYFEVIENGVNDFTLDYAILGSETAGITTPEILFSITFHGAEEGSAIVAIPSAIFRDLDNLTIPIDFSSQATITVDCTAPVAVPTALASPGHEQTTVTWTDSPDLDLSSVLLLRGLWHDGAQQSVYPGYAQTAGNTIPTQFPTYAEYVVSPEWELAGTVDPGIGIFLDPVTTRGIYYYQLLAVDTAGNVSPPMADSPAATNYLLGDVATPYDGEVDIADLSLLGDSYGVACGHQYYNAEVDIGPTDNGSGHGLPVPDCLVGFEDLMIFGANFGGVALAKSPPAECGELNISWVQQSELEWSCVLRQPCPSLKGLHLVAVGQGMQGAQVERGALLYEQSGQVFLQKADSPSLDIGLVVLGAGQGIEGAGELFRVTLASPLASFNPTIEARDTSNQVMGWQLLTPVVDPLPTRYALGHNYPNPFNPSTTIHYSLPEEGDVNLSIYSVDGRLVRTLVYGLQQAGNYDVVWDGRTDRNRAVASGIYFYRLEAGAFSAMKKMVLIK